MTSRRFEVAWALGVVLCACTPNADGSQSSVVYAPGPVLPLENGPLTAPPPTTGPAGQAGSAAGVAGAPDTGAGTAGMPTGMDMPSAMAGAPGGTGGTGGIAGMTGAAGAAGSMGGAGATGASGAGGSGGMGTTPTGPKPTQLVVSVTTLQQGGQWQPQNAGVMFIQDANGKWVRTLEVWASINLQYLNRYTRTPGAPLYNFDFFTPIPPDVVTSNTLMMHATHMRSWDLKDVNGREVPDGMYKLVIDLTDREKADGVSQEYPFTKGASPITLTPPDAQYYTGAKLSLE